MVPQATPGEATDQASQMRPNSEPAHPPVSPANAFHLLPGDSQDHWTGPDGIVLSSAMRIHKATNISLARQPRLVCGSGCPSCPPMFWTVEDGEARRRQGKSPKDKRRKAPLGPNPAVLRA